MITLLTLLACSAPEVPAPPAPSSDAASSVVVGAHHAYAALGERGLAVLDEQGRELRRLPPPEGLDAVHDLAMYNVLLFGLDATAPGGLVVWSLADPASPRRTDGPVPVPVEPYAGVSVHNGVVAVVGGGSLEVFTYDGRGQLRPHRSSARVDRGPSDVLLNSRGELALVSTQFEQPQDGSEFGLSAVQLRQPPEAPVVSDRLGLEGAGLTEGGSTPVGFPLGAALQGSLLYLAHGGGLDVVDVSAPEALRRLARVELPVKGVAVALEDDRAYVVGAHPAPTLVELDLAEPEAPRVLEAVELAATPRGVAARKGRVFVATEAGVVVMTRRDAPPGSVAEFADRPYRP